MENVLILGVCMGIFCFFVVDLLKTVPHQGKYLKFGENSLTNICCWSKSKHTEFDWEV